MFLMRRGALHVSYRVCVHRGFRSKNRRCVKPGAAPPRSGVAGSVSIVRISVAQHRAPGAQAPAVVAADCRLTRASGEQLLHAPDHPPYLVNYVCLTGATMRVSFLADTVSLVRL